MKRLMLMALLSIQTMADAAGQPKEEVYRFRADIEAGIEKDTLSWKYQLGATAYSFAGAYMEALSTWDKGPSARVYTPRNADSALLRSANIVDAAAYVIARSEKEQIVIVNEAHHNPRHRAFTRSLLKGLYENGYRYLGLEALSDSLINKRGYAVAESGYYTNEPEFGNLIKEALDIGFVVFGYEASEGKNGKEREIEQALNIRKFLTEHPAGKLLIHCGFDHAFEKEVPAWEKAMAGRLKEYLDIDPLTIDQVKFSEKSSPGLAHYFVYAAAAADPFVLVDGSKQVFNGFAEPKQTDISVIHPLTKYEHGRPGWLSTGKKPYRLPGNRLKKYTFPVQVLVYRIGEYEHKGIPADIAEIEYPDHAGPLYLGEGHFQIVVRDRNYKVIDMFTTGK